MALPSVHEVLATPPPVPLAAREPEALAAPPLLPAMAKLGVQVARSPGARLILDQLLAATTLARQRFVARISHGAETTRGRVAQTQQSLLAAAEGQRKAIQGSFAATGAQLDQHIAVAERQLDADEGIRRAAMEEHRAARLADGENVFRTRQDHVDKLAATYADRSVQMAEQVSEQLVSQTQARSDEAESIGNAKAQVGGSTPEIVEAKAKVAHEIASDTVGKISDGVSDGAEQLRATGPQAADAFRQHGNEIRDQLGAGQPQLVNQVTAVFQNAGTMLHQAHVAGKQQLGHLRKVLTGHLSSAEQTTLTQLHTHAVRKSQETRVAGDRAISSLHGQGEKALTAGEGGWPSWANTSHAPPSARGPHPSLPGRFLRK